MSAKSLTLLFIALFFAKNLLAADFPDLRNEYLIITSININNVGGFKAKCEKNVLESQTDNNHISYASEENVYFHQDIECEEKPNFDMIGFRATGNDKVFKAIIGNKQVDGNGFKNKSSYMLTCAYKELNWSADKGKISCTFDSFRNSTITVVVD